jgi:hypothetical protein
MRSAHGKDVRRRTGAVRSTGSATAHVHIRRQGDAPQSELRVGHVGVPRSHRDSFPIVVMNAILGGLFSSRINLNLREAHAYTYGAFSSFDWRRGRVRSPSRRPFESDVTDAAVREILLEIERMRSAGGYGRRADAGDELPRWRVPDSLRVDDGHRERAREPSCRTGCLTTTSIAIAHTFARSRGRVLRAAREYCRGAAADRHGR